MMHWRRGRNYILLTTLLLLSAFVLAGAAQQEEKKGWLGVMIQELTPSLKEAMGLGDRKGILVAEVMPDSPAEKAGIEEEDVILTFNGASIERAEVLTEKVRAAGVGSEVKVEVFRDGKVKALTVKLSEARERRRMVWRDKDSEDNVFVVKTGRAQLGITPHDLDEPELAAYFKVEEKSGVLVMSVSKESAASEAGLLPGDVITRVADEKITDTDDLLEVLGEHEAGDKVSVQVMRQGKKRTLTAELDEGSNDFFGMHNIFDARGNRFMFKGSEGRKHKNRRFRLHTPRHHGSGDVEIFFDDEHGGEKVIKERIKVRNKKSGASI